MSNFESIAARLARHPDAQVQAVGDFFRSHASTGAPDETDARLSVLTMLQRIGADINEQGSVVTLSSGERIRIDFHDSAAEAHGDCTLEAIPNQKCTLIAGFIEARSPNLTTIVDEMTPA